MNLKEKIKRFWTLNVHNHEGFTLVELIIVIAILAILSSVAVVGYSSYITKANKQADKTMVAEVVNALTLAYYANPNAGDMVVSVVLTADGAEAADNNAFVIKAMEDAFGANWKTGLKLKHNGWGNGVAVSKDALAHFIANINDEHLGGIYNGSANISFTDNIPELFELTKEVATMIAGAGAADSGAQLVTDAAAITGEKNVEAFAELWASRAWESDFFMESSGADYSGDTSSYSEEQLGLAIANAGVIKARNVALATYLRDLGYGDAADIISNYTYEGTVVPDDACGAILNGEADKLGLGNLPAETQDAIANAVFTYYGMNPETGEISDPTASQAYTDGLAYYAMMSTVDSLSESNNLDKTNDETWWNDLYSAVDLYSAIANGSVTVEDLNDMYNSIDAGENTVLVMLTVVNGNPEVKAYPLDVNA